MSDHRHTVHLCAWCDKEIKRCDCFEKGPDVEINRHLFCREHSHITHMYETGEILSHAEDMGYTMNGFYDILEDDGLIPEEGEIYVKMSDCDPKTSKFSKDTCKVLISFMKSDDVEHITYFTLTAL